MSLWTINNDRIYKVDHPTTAHLEAGWYECQYSYDKGVHLRKREIKTERLVHIPNSVTPKVVNSIDIFWAAADKYKELSILHKRGILMAGNPGIGKSGLINEICNILINAHDGIVLVASGRFDHLEEMIVQIRQVEPERKIIVLIEDIERFIEESEEKILSLMSGQNQIDHCVFLATTNFIERLPARLTNRPGRFDEIIILADLDYIQRLGFIRSFSRSVDFEACDYLAKGSEGFAISHLKELIVSYFCLGMDKDETLARLRKMVEVGPIEELPNKLDDNDGDD